MTGFTGTGFKVLLAACLLTPLAACGGKESSSAGGEGGSEASSGEGISVSDLEEKASGMARPKPGKYRQTVEMLGMEIPGMSKEMAGQLGSMKMTSETTDSCVTEQDSEGGFRDMFRNDAGKGGDCSYSRFDVSGGQLDARMTCTVPDQGTAVVEMNGTVSETSSDITISTEMSGSAAPSGNVKTKVHLVSERIGDCD